MVLRSRFTLSRFINPVVPGAGTAAGWALLPCNRIQNPSASHSLLVLPKDAPPSCPHPQNSVPALWASASCLCCFLPSDRLPGLGRQLTGSRAYCVSTGRVSNPRRGCGVKTGRFQGHGDWPIYRKWWAPGSVRDPASRKIRWRATEGDVMSSFSL